MWPLSFILVLVLTISKADLFVGISNLTKSLHTLCLNFTPKSVYSHVYASLICGRELEGHELIQNLKNLGIYHAIIVSGSHLVFLSSVIETIFYAPHFKKLKVAAIFILFIYSLATGFEPPVVRALVSMGIFEIQKNRKLFWNQNEIIFISLLICLCLFDPWKRSYSLLLSYVASTVLSLCSNKNVFQKNLNIYLLILPFLLPLSAPNFLSFLTNIFLNPMIGLILFPMSFLTYFVPGFTFFVDPLWKLFLFLCNTIGPELKSMDKVKVSQNTLWLMAIFLNLFGIFKDKKVFK